MLRYKWAMSISVVLVALAVGWCAARNSEVGLPVAELAVPRDPQEAAPVPVRAEHDLTRLHSKPATASEETSSAETVVRVAVAAEPTLEAKARAFLAKPKGSDVGINTIRETLLSAILPPADIDPFVEPMPSVDALLQSDYYNPSRVELGAADVQVAADLIAEYGARLRLAKRDVHLADRLSLAEAIQNGDFVTRPNGSDPGGIGRNLRADVKARNPDGRWLSGVLPGSDFSHNRFVMLEQSKYPAYFAAQDAMNMLRAEFVAAVKSMFSAASRARR